MYAVVAGEFGMDPDELQRDCEAFLSQPLAQQLAEVDHLKAELGDEFTEYDEVRATLIREYWP